MSDAAARIVSGAGPVKRVPDQRPTLAVSLVKGLPILAVAALVLIPLLGASSFDLARYSTALCYIMSVVGLNLAFGYAGQLVLGHSVIMAAAAYTAGMLSARAEWSGAAAAPVAIIAGTAAGVLMMLPGLRVRGWYLALITLFSVLVLPKLIAYCEPWTGGEYGLTGIQPFDLFGIVFSPVMLYEAVVVCMVVVWLGVQRFVRSSWGLRMRALRDAERAADAVGIDLTRTRLLVFVVSSVPAAVSGVLLAYTEQFVNADSFGIGLALLLLTGMVLGGLGTKWGPIFGMVPLMAFSFWVGPFSQYNSLILGVALMVFAVIFTDGFAPVVTSIARRFGLIAAPRYQASATAAQSTLTDAVDLEPSNTRILDVSHIAKTFGGVRALDDVSLSLKGGQLCGIVGPNGSGKSTLLNAISGFIRADDGHVRVADQPLEGLRPFEIARLGIGRTFQVPLLVEELTVSENVEIGLVGTRPAARAEPSERSTNADERRRLARHAIDIVGLPPDVIEQPVSDLPLGLKRVVEIARAIASNPKLVLLDEPAAGLNESERTSLGHLLRRLSRSGIAVAVIEHDMPFVMTFCDEVIVLQAGRITAHAALDAELPRSLLDYLDFGVEPRPASFWKDLRHAAG